MPSDPTHSQECEVYAAALMVGYPDRARSLITALPSEAFDLDLPRQVATAVALIVSDGAEPTLGEIVERIGGGWPLDLIDLAVPALSDAAICRTILGGWQRREAARLLGEARAEVEAGTLDPDGIEDYVEAGMRRFEHRTATLRPVADPIREIATATEAVRSVAIVDDVDRLIGGLQAGRLHIVGAATGGGKTAFAVDCAVRAGAAGVPVLIVSLEMSEREMAARIAARIVERAVSLPRVGTSDEIWQAVRSRCTTASQHAAAAHIVVRDDLERVADIVREADRQPWGLIVVDYLQLVEADGQHDSREREVASISRALKRLAMSRGVPVLALSQLNADGAARESRAIEQDADVILSILPNGEDGKDLARRIFAVKKQRNGPLGSAELDYAKPIHRFSALQIGPRTAQDEVPSWM
jgi:KaiC/GvpD/RAD55 family RecA-like ATPase